MFKKLVALLLAVLLLLPTVTYAKEGSGKTGEDNFLEFTVQPNDYQLAEKGIQFRNVTYKGKPLELNIEKSDPGVEEWDEEEDGEDPYFEWYVVTKHQQYIKETPTEDGVMITIFDPRSSKDGSNVYNLNQDKNDKPLYKSDSSERKNNSGSSDGVFSGFIPTLILLVLGSSLITALGMYLYNRFIK